MEEVVASVPNAAGMLAAAVFEPPFNLSVVIVIVAVLFAFFLLRVDILHAASRFGFQKLVRAILAMGIIVVDARDSEGFTPLALACINGHTRVMHALLEAEADPRQEFEAEKTLRSARWICMTNRNERHWPTDKETTAAFLACATGNKDMLELMLQFGVSVDDQFQGATLLTAAANANCEEAKDVVRLLLDRGAKMDVIDISGMAALHVACFRWDLDVSRLLLQAGASVNIRDVYGDTPLLLACESSGDLDMVELLLQFKADVNLKNDITPLMAALFSDNEDNTTLMNLTISYGADIHAESDDGRTALHMAVFAPSVEATRVILEHGGNVEATSDDGFTPFLFSAQDEELHEFSEQLMQDLLSHHLDVLPEYE